MGRTLAQSHLGAVIVPDVLDRLKAALAERYLARFDNCAKDSVCSRLETRTWPRGARLALKGGGSRVFQDASPQGPSPLFRAGTAKADR